MHVFVSPTPTPPHPEKKGGTYAKNVEYAAAYSVYQNS